MSELELRGKLFKKLAKISMKIGAMEKDGTNSFAKWSFISAEKMLAACRDRFDEMGIYLISAIIPELTKHEECGKTSSGAIIFKTTVTMKFNWVDCDTGYKSEDILFSGQDQDQAKGFSQAITDCHKRFLFKSFNVSSAKDQDPDNNLIEIAKTVQSDKNERKRKFVDIYKSSKLSKTEKDTIVAEIKLLNGEDYLSWDQQVIKELEERLNGNKKFGLAQKKETPSFDKIMNGESVVDEIEKEMK